MRPIQDIRDRVAALIAAGKQELLQIEAQESRTAEVESKAQEIRQALTPLVEDLDQLIKQFAGRVNPTVEQLINEKTLIQAQIEGAELAAEQELDEQLIQEEERAFARQGAEELRAWRYQIKADLISLIEEQEDFYDATDMAVSVKDYSTELKEIGALEEVVDRLLEQINRYDLKRDEKEQPTARVKGSYEHTIGFIADIAIRNRSNSNHPPKAAFKANREKPTGKPVVCEGLKGKVVVIGGHERLESAVRNQIRQSDIELVWATAETGPNIWKQVEQHVLSADLVIVLTGYVSHKLTNSVLGDMSGIKPIYLAKAGMTRLIDTIESELKRHKLFQANGKVTLASAN